MENLKRLPQAQSWPMLLTNFFNRDTFNEGNLNFFDNRTSIPAVNITETADSFAIEVAAPGMSKDDFKVELDGNELILTAEKKQQAEENAANYHRREFSLNALKRTFTLPVEMVNTENINAKYTDGILSLTIPKKEEAIPKPSRRIEIL